MEGRERRKMSSAIKTIKKRILPFLPKTIRWGGCLPFPSQIHSWTSASHVLKLHRYIYIYRIDTVSSSLLAHSSGECSVSSRGLRARVREQGNKELHDHNSQNTKRAGLPSSSALVLTLGMACLHGTYSICLKVLREVSLSNFPVNGCTHAGKGSIHLCLSWGLMAFAGSQQPYISLRFLCL